MTRPPEWRHGALDANDAGRQTSRRTSPADELLMEEEAEVFLALAGALAASGRPEQAREVVARGASRLDYLAGRIADADWRARFLVEVPLNRRLIELDGAAE